MDNLISFLIAAAIIGGFLAYYTRQEKKKAAKVRDSAERGKLRSDGPVIPKLLQHESQVSRAPMPPHDHARRWHNLMHAQFLIYLEHPWFFVSPYRFPCF